MCDVNSRQLLEQLIQKKEMVYKVRTVWTKGKKFKLGSTYRVSIAMKCEALYSEVEGKGLLMWDSSLELSRPRNSLLSRVTH